jgi:hypothetical protein
MIIERQTRQRLNLARSVSAGTHGDFRSWGWTGCAIGLPATAALDPKRSSAMLPRNPSKPLCRSTRRPRRAPTSEARSPSAPRECKQVLVKSVHMREGQTVRGALIHFELAACNQACRLSSRTVNG